MMKKTKKGFKSLAILLALVLAIGFIPAANVSAKTAPRLNYKKVTIVQGKKKRLKVKGTKKKVKWSSTKKSVVTVDKKGVIKAKKKGKATIIAKVGKKKLRCKVTVKKKPAKKKSSKKTSTSVKKQLLDGSGAITLSRLSIPVIVGGKVNLLDYMNASAVNTLNKVSKSNRVKYYKWYSSNNNVLTIDAKNFTAIGKKAGTVKIYCKYYAKNGRWYKSNTAEVVVGDAGDVKFSYSLSLEDSPFTNKEYKVWNYYKHDSYDTTIPKFNTITVTIQNNSTKSITIRGISVDLDTVPSSINFESSGKEKVIIPANTTNTIKFYAYSAEGSLDITIYRNYIIDQEVFKKIGIGYNYRDSQIVAENQKGSVHWKYY